MDKKPIIKVFFARPTEAYYNVSEEKRKEAVDLNEKNKKELGIKTIVTCNSYWGNEEWEEFGVEEYPDIEAVQKHAEFLLKREWPKYIISKTYLGTQWATSE